MTNVLLHAGAEHVSLAVSSRRNKLHVEITDDGAGGGTGPTDGGNGIPGMRERIASVGGTLTAGPVDHGWSVAAVLPLQRVAT